MRMRDNRLPKATLIADGLPGWKRPQGGQRKTWRRTVKSEDLVNFERKFSLSDIKFILAIVVCLPLENRRSNNIGLTMSV